MRCIKIGMVSPVVLAAFVAYAGPAAAQEDGQTGFELGFRVGYAIPMGKAIDEDDGDMTEAISGQLPLQLDLGGRVTPNLMIGAYFSYGFGFSSDDLDEACDTLDVDCSLHVLRVGAQLQYHFSPRQEIDPWLGAGIGYEWLTFDLSGNDTDVSSTYSGFEFINLAVGLDFPAGAAGGIGPFFSFSLAQYDKVSASCDGQCGTFDDDSESIDQKAMHQWLMVGFRGTFVL